nr:MAG TPA: hypothetical protein [Caudoviricetes sp.]
MILVARGGSFLLSTPRAASPTKWGVSSGSRLVEGPR